MRLSTEKNKKKLLTVRVGLFSLREKAPTKNETTGAFDNVKSNRMLNDNDEKGTIFTRIYLKVVFSFLRHLDKRNYSLGYTLTMKRADSGNSIYRLTGDVAKLEFKDIVWYVRHDTPSFYNISLANEHTLSKKNTEYSYVSRMVSYKPLNSNHNWMMAIGVEGGSDEPIFVIIGFQSAQKAGPNQTQNNARFDRLDVIEASCNVGTQRYPDHEFQIDYQRNKYNEAYNEVRRFYRDYIKGEGSPYISFKDFKELHNHYVFDLRAQKDNPSAQPIRVNFKFRAGYDVVANNYQAVALVSSQNISAFQVMG